RQGIRPARLPGAQLRRGHVAHAYRRAGLGHELRQRHQRGRRCDASAACEDRRSLRRQAHPHRARRGLRDRGASAVNARGELPPPPRGPRKSLTWRISLRFALFSFRVIAAMGFAIDRMLASELLEANDVLLLGNMSLVRNRLTRPGAPEPLLAAPRFVEEMAMGY